MTIYRDSRLGCHRNKRKNKHLILKISLRPNLKETDFENFLSLWWVKTKTMKYDQGLDEGGMSQTIQNTLIFTITAAAKAPAFSLLETYLRSHFSSLKGSVRGLALQELQVVPLSGIWTHLSSVKEDISCPLSPILTKTFPWLSVSFHPMAAATTKSRRSIHAPLFVDT